MRSIGLAIGLLLLAVPALAAPTESVRLHAAWHAPYGEPRARATLETACDDTAATDTLYLSFELLRPMPAITVVRAALGFHPAAGDSLRAFWEFKTGMPNGGNMLIDFAPFHDVVHESPWTDHGAYGVTYTRMGAGARLELENFVPFDLATGLDPGIRYCFARVRIQHRRADLPGCRQPVCVEWSNALLGFATGRELAVRGGDERLVRWNADERVDCGLAGPASLTKPWTPKTRR
jgi:hypothetical protein